MRPVDCTPICPFRAFMCARRALVIRRRGGRLYAFCEWTGDRCIGWRCQYAVCMRHALSPDGKCGLLMKRKRRPSIDEEAARVKESYADLRKRLKKLGVDVEGEV